MEIKRYPFQFSTLMSLLIALGFALCAAGLGLTTWRSINFLSGDLSSVYEWLQYILLYFVCILLSVLLTAMLIRSQYVITEKELIVQFGIIRQKFSLATVYSVHLFRGSNKLAVYFDDFKTKYVVIVVKEKWYDDFIKTLTARNERIAFSFSTAEEEEEVKRKKK